MLGLYRHCGIEVLVDADSGGNLIVQPSAVEKWLLMRHRTSTGNHSLTAYRDCMEACFDPEDLVLYLPKARRIWMNAEWTQGPSIQSLTSCRRPIHRC